MDAIEALTNATVGLIVSWCLTWAWLGFNPIQSAGITEKIPHKTRLSLCKIKDFCYNFGKMIARQRITLPVHQREGFSR